MADLSRFQITNSYPPERPDVIQLYSFPTPNGVKASIALEEMELDYEPHLVKLNETETPDFLSLNPNNKIPAIIDPNGPDGEPMALWESGAILLYLAEKTGKLVPADNVERMHCIQWMFFQVGHVGPMFGQFGHFFKFAADKVSDPYPKDRYRGEAKRAMRVIEGQLEKAGGPHLLGDQYTIADIMIWPWIRGAKVFYEAGDELEMDSFPRTMEWWQRCAERPASQRGLTIPARPAS